MRVISAGGGGFVQLGTLDADRMGMSADPSPPGPMPSETALIDLASPPAVSNRRGPARFLRLSAPGRVAYGLAWLCVLVLVVTTVVFANVEADVMLALKIVLSVVAVLAAVCLHLAAVSLNRRRDVGYSVFAACLIVLLAAPLVALTATVATATAFGSVVSDAFGDSSESIPGVSSFLDDDEESLDEPIVPGSDSTTVPCLAPDDSVIQVEPEYCIDGHYNP